MATGLRPIGDLEHQIRTLFEVGPIGPFSDAELLDCFMSARGWVSLLACPPVRSEGHRQHRWTSHECHPSVRTNPSSPCGANPTGTQHGSGEGGQGWRR